MTRTTNSLFAQRARSKNSVKKGLLLPLPEADASAISLEYHLALAALRSGYANDHLVNLLLKTVYAAYLLLKMDYEHEEFDAFREAETVLQRLGDHLDSPLSESDSLTVGSVLVIHDQQLAYTPVRKIADVHRHLIRMASSGPPVLGMGNCTSNTPGGAFEQSGDS